MEENSSSGAPVLRAQNARPETPSLAGSYTPAPWIAFNMIHAERGDAMTPEEIGEYVANNVRKTIADGGAADRFLFISTAGPGAPDICHVGNGPAGPANACLIASAPDLVGTLYGIAGEAEGQHADPHQTLKVIAEYARAAIARAEGRPQ